MPNAPSEVTKRVLELVKRTNTLSVRVIGAKVGVTGQRVHQILHEHGYRWVAGWQALDPKASA